MDYHSYIKSSKWQRKKRAHKKTGLSSKCISCDSSKIELHHRSYERLGSEQILDLLPLCRDCHQKVHDYSKAHGIPIQATHKILRMLNGWSRKETRRRFAKYTTSKKGFRWVSQERKR